MIYLLHHTVAASARAFPQREAFVCGAERVTYGELHLRVRQLARALVDGGVQPGDRVGIYLNRCIETATAIFGILRAGAVYVPLNPKAPPAYNQSVIDDCDIEVLVSHPSQKRTLKKLVGPLTHEGDEAHTHTQAGRIRSVVGCAIGDPALATVTWEEVYQIDAAGLPEVRRVATDLAYIIYTSGSTGKPKGIMHSHASGLAFARNAVARYGFTGADRFGNHAPIYFDISQLAYFGAPLVGGTAVVATDAETLFPINLADLIERERVTVWYSVPLVIVQWLNANVLEKLNASDLQHVFYAGEALAPKYARRALRALPTVRIANWYGPAETNVCTCYELTGPPRGDEAIPIGEVWDNTDRVILDQASRPVTPGEIGELCIHSSTQMLGYWNLPERSAAAWYEHSESGGPPRKFYRTGDLVREDESGKLDLLGRADHQVKVRGYRVELGAVEKLLLQHPIVAEACALTTRDGKDDALTLRAAVTLERGDAGNTEEKDLLTYLKSELPWYAVPQSITTLVTFPRTATDKTDRAALAAQLTEGE